MLVYSIFAPLGALGGIKFLGSYTVFFGSLPPLLGG